MKLPTPTIFAVALSSFIGPWAAAQLAIVNNLPGSFTDISQTGTLISLGDEDEGLFATTISNAIFPAGMVVVGNNGAIGFMPIFSTELAPTPGPLPSPLCFGGSKALAPYWADIGNHTGTIHFQEVGGVLIVQFTGKPSKNTGNKATFQIKVFGGVAGPACTGIYAQMIYRDIEQPDFFGGLTASIGFQGDVLVDSVQWSLFQQQAVQDGTVLSLVCENAGTCPSDFNHDGFVTGDDFDLYVAAFELGDPSADFNGDGFVTGDDFDAFVLAFTNGC